MAADRAAGLSEAQRALAERIAADLSAGDYEAVAARFDDTVREKLPVALLAEQTDALKRERLGAFVSAERAVGTGKQATVAMVSCRFERGWATVSMRLDERGRIAALWLSPSPPPAAADEAVATLARSLTWSTPLMLAVPLAFAALLGTLGGGVRAGPLLLGAVGWMVALALRIPVAMLSKSAARRDTILVGASGPLEETVRLTAIGSIEGTFAAAGSLGLGWGGIEVLYAVSQSVMAFRLSRRADERAQMIRQQLADQGFSLPRSPAIGIIERVSATAYHVGATLLVAASAWWMLLLVPVHSGLNLGAARFARSSMAITQAFAAAIGVPVFVAGLAAWGAL